MKWNNTLSLKNERFNYFIWHDGIHDHVVFYRITGPVRHYVSNCSLSQSFFLFLLYPCLLTSSIISKLFLPLPLYPQVRLSVFLRALITCHIQSLFVFIIINKTSSVFLYSVQNVLNIHLVSRMSSLHSSPYQNFTDISPYPYLRSLDSIRLSFLPKFHVPRPYNRTLHTPSSLFLISKSVVLKNKGIF